MASRYFRENKYFVVISPTTSRYLANMNILIVMFLFNADSELNIGQFKNQIELLCENAVLTRGLQELP